MDSNIELRHSLSLSFTADDGASQDVPVQLVLTHNASDFSEVAVHCASRSHEGVETRVLLTTSRNFSPDRRKLLGLHMQSTACLNRFGPEDLVYFWADYGSRVDLLAVKVGFEESNAGMPSNVMDAEASPGETLGRSVPPIKCSPCDVLYSFEVAKLLANVTDGNINVKNSHLTLLKVEVCITLIFLTFNSFIMIPDCVLILIYYIYNAVLGYKYAIRSRFRRVSTFLPRIVRRHSHICIGCNQSPCFDREGIRGSQVTIHSDFVTNCAETICVR
jgi:hypothetical protein